MSTDSQPIAPAEKTAERGRFWSNTTFWWLVGFAVIGAALRAATITTRGLWLDEASTVIQSSGTLLQTIQSQIGGTHPPFFHVLMHFWMHAFGAGEAAIRAFAAAFGVASIPAAYWAGKVIYDRRAGLIAAGILAVSPFAIWYSQDARMYTMLLFFALLSAGTFALALDRNDVRSWAAYFAFTLMGSFTHYLFLLLVIGQGVYFVLFEIVDREVWASREGTREFSIRRPLKLFADIPLLGPYAATVGLMAVPVLVWLNWAVFFPPGQEAALAGAVTTSGLGYGAPPPSLAIRFNDVLETLVEVLFGSHSPAVTYGLAAMWPLLIYFVLVVMGGSRYLTRRTTMLLCSASGLLVVWGLGQWQGTVLLSRYLTPMVGPALILLAGVVSRMALVARRTPLAVIVAVSLAAYVSQSFDPNSVLRYQNREAIDYIVAHKEPGDLIIYEPFYIDHLVNYYLPEGTAAYGFPRFDGKGSFRDSPTQISQDLTRIIGPARRVWVIRSFQNVRSIGYQAYLTDRWFQSHGYQEKQHVALNKVEWLLFTSRASTTTPVGGGAAP